MDEAKAVVMMFHATINQLPDEERDKIMACAKRLRELIAEYGEAGNYALGLVGAEEAAKNE